MKYFIVLLALLGIIFSGCEPIEENSDVSINDSYKPNAVNTCNLSEESTLGCFGDNLEFGDNEILAQGYWSIYDKRSINELENYNTYLYSYRFFGNGYAQTVNKMQAYYSLTWGVDEKGSVIKTDNEGTITYKGIFQSDNRCYEIDHSTLGKALKMCHDDATVGKENDLGFYSETIKFGNYIHGNYTVIGTWTVSNYDTTKINETYILDANGTTKDGSSWGVSEDGKVLHIKDASYLIREYLDGECLLCVDIKDNEKTLLQLCKDSS